MVGTASLIYVVALALLAVPDLAVPVLVSINCLRECLPALRAFSGIALDVASGKMYWGDQDTANIQRANLDGRGERSRSQLLLKLGGTEIVLILAVNILAVKFWLLIFGC